jgi:HAD superfamily hydrolase (TIGR01509 family)
MGNIKNIVFDLGNVLFDIDYNKTISAFEQIGFENFKESFSPEKMDGLFKNLEKGTITEDYFYTSIKSISTMPLTNSEIKNAWNAMLLNFRIESLVFLQKIKHKYNLYLLSNTNSIHLTEVNKIFIANVGVPSLNNYFIKAYYSNLIGLRKPDVDTYIYVLKHAGINAEETLFIDDLETNINGARLAGMQTHLLLPSQRVENINL